MSFELFETDMPYIVGTLVKIGGTKEITQTDHDADPGVFGVVTYGNVPGTDAANLLVGLSGRQKVRAVGTVGKGDALVASKIPGVARSVGKLDATVESLSFVYSIIGRALEAKSSNVESLISAFVGKN